jgi:WD40 repeat protein
MRVVRGVPVSWDPAIATVRYSHRPGVFAWSPCSTFIAVNLPFWDKDQIQILDGITLERLQTFTVPRDIITELLIFSPESRMLTCVAWGVAISWDVHTGVLVSEITMDLTKDTDMRSAISITCSVCGTMFAVLFYDHASPITTICTYHVHRSTATQYHQIKEPVLHQIWTFGECIRFATFGSGSITIWEVGFNSEHPPTEIESLPVPDNVGPSNYCLFLPTHSWLAFVNVDENTAHSQLASVNEKTETVSVWDAQRSKLLLSSMVVKYAASMTFSSDGRFFACGADKSETCLWKESPTGYIIHQKLISQFS